jgi:hypothetical protein
VSRLIYGFALQVDDEQWLLVCGSSNYPAIAAMTAAQFVTMETFCSA